MPPLRRRAHNKEQIPDQPPTTDFDRMDILGDTPPPATVIDACNPDGFELGGGMVTITGGSGALLVGGEAFGWRPWDEENKKLVNAKGQWEVGRLEDAFGLLSVVWPRPGKVSPLRYDGKMSEMLTRSRSADIRTWSRDEAYQSGGEETHLFAGHKDRGVGYEERGVAV